MIAEADPVTSGEDKWFVKDTRVLLKIHVRIWNKWEGKVEQQRLVKQEYCFTSRFDYKLSAHLLLRSGTEAKDNIAFLPLSLQFICHFSLV